MEVYSVLLDKIDNVHLDSRLKGCHCSTCFLLSRDSSSRCRHPHHIPQAYFHWTLNGNYLVTTMAISDDNWFLPAGLERVTRVAKTTTRSFSFIFSTAHKKLGFGRDLVTR